MPETLKPSAIEDPEEMEITAQIEEQALEIQKQLDRIAMQKFGRKQLSTPVEDITEAMILAAKNNELEIDACDPEDPRVWKIIEKYLPQAKDRVDSRLKPLGVQARQDFRDSTSGQAKSDLTRAARAIK